MRRKEMAEAVDACERGGCESNGHEVGEEEKRRAKEYLAIQCSQSEANDCQRRHQRNRDRHTNDGAMAPSDHSVRCAEACQHCHAEIEQVRPVRAAISLVTPWIGETSTRSVEKSTAKTTPTPNDTSDRLSAS